MLILLTVIVPLVPHFALFCQVFTPQVTKKSPQSCVARRIAGIPDLHIHDLRHTVGMRLREAGVREETIADILWHARQGMTAHYSVVQIDELVEALNRINNEGSRVNRSLAMIRREQLGEKSHPKVPIKRKMG